MPNVACPVPKAIGWSDADRVYRQVRQELKGLGSDAYKREAARRLGIEREQFDEVYSAAGKRAGKTAVPGGKSLPVKPPAGLAGPVPKPAGMDDPIHSEWDWRQNLGEGTGPYAKQITDVLRRQAELIGDEALKGLHIRVVPRKYMPEDAIAAHFQGEIMFDRAVFQPRFMATAQRFQRTGFWVMTDADPVSSTLWHEIGHDLMRYIDEERRLEALRAMAKELDVKPPFFGHDRIVDRWIINNQKTLEHTVSRYGVEDSGELYAEMWAAYCDNPLGCNPAIKAWGDSIRATVRKRYGLADQRSA